MKEIDAIIIHCSATHAGQDLRAKDIDRMHKQRGFSQIGYNFVIDLDGMVENGRPLSIDGAHCNTKGFLLHRIINIPLVCVILADWIQTGNLLIHGRPLKELVCVSWWQSSVRSTRLLKFSAIAILHRTWMEVVR